MNEKIARWIKSSLAVHFATVCSAATVNFKIEDDDRPIGDWQKWVELRITELNVTKQQPNQYVINVDIDLLVTAQPAAANLYLVDDVIGLLLKNVESVPINNDDGFWFCLTLDRELKHSTRIFDYGRLAGVKTKRASLLAYYENEVEVN